MPDALQMLRDDHRRVKDLFRRFEETEDERQRGQIVQETLKELMVHAELEEELFYPAVRGEAGVEGEMMDEADEEHHVAEMLIDELWKMRPGSSHYDAKFTVLAEAVKHHIDEEESEILPKAAELGMGRMDELGAQMEQRKMQLMKDGGRRMRPTSRSTAGTTRRRTTAGSSRNGRSVRTTARTTSRSRPRATTSTRSRAGSSRTASARAKTSTSRGTTGRSTSRSRATSTGRSTGARTTSTSRGSTSRARR